MIALKRYIKKHKVTAYIRMTLIVLFAITLLVTICLNDYAFEPFYIPLQKILVDCFNINWGAYMVLKRLLTGIVMAYIFWICVINLIPFRESLAPKPRGIRRDRGWKRKLSSAGSFCLLSTPFTVFILQIVLAVISLVFCMAQKFASAPAPDENDLAAGVRMWCGLNQREDNEWGFAQITAMLLLAIPIFYSLEVYFGKFAAAVTL
jgi:type III secretory pathway component EscU